MNLFLAYVFVSDFNIGCCNSAELNENTSLIYNTCVNSCFANIYTCVVFGFWSTLNISSLYPVA